MKRTNTVADALNSNIAQVDPGDGLPVIPIPLDGKMPGYPGPPGPGVPEGGTTGQMIEKTSDGSTQWVTPTKAKFGLGNVDNTADANKPISTATQTALDAKASKIELDAKADLVNGRIPVAQIPVEATVTDANVAAQIDAPQTGAAIDARINAEVAPQVQQITADYIAGDQAVIDAAAAAVDSNPKIQELQLGIQLTTGAHLDTVTEPNTYFQQENVNAKLDLGYPVEKAGVLNVDRWNLGGENLMEQYWPYNHEGFFFRHVYYTSKAWKEIPTKTAVQAMIDTQISPARSSRTSVVAIGDSLTDGYSNGTFWPVADKWPTILDSLLPAAAVTEYGLSGHTVDGTMLYIGAHKPRFVVPGGTIPADGTAVPVTSSQVYNIPQALSIGGTLAGVTGVLMYDHWGGGGWTFRSLNGGTASGITGLHEFKSLYAGTWEASTAIIWLGRNDISNAYAGIEVDVVDHIVASTKKLVAEISPRVKQIMICGVTTRVSEEQGSDQHTWITETNNRLRDAFPEYFKSAQDYLRDEALLDLGITPNSTDTAKIAAGTVPPSVMDDDTHISKATADAMARYFFQPFLTGKGYVD